MTFYDIIGESVNVIQYTQVYIWEYIVLCTPECRKSFYPVVIVLNI